MDIVTYNCGGTNCRSDGLMQIQTKRVLFVSMSDKKKRLN
jgi:hypothetical protein